MAYNLSDLRAMTNNGMKISKGSMYNPITQEEMIGQNGCNMAINGAIMNEDLLYPDEYGGIQTRKLPELPGKVPSDSGIY